MGSSELKVRATPISNDVNIRIPLIWFVETIDSTWKYVEEVGSKELTCGSQAHIATLLFDPSMSALPIIVLHKAQSVGLFTRQQGTWAGFRPSWDRLVLPYWWIDTATVIQPSTKGTADSDNWLIRLFEKAVPWSYHLLDNDWLPLSQNLCWKPVSQQQ